MARNLENSTSGNSNIQEMGSRRSTRLNMTIGETAPPPLVSTMGTTTVATSVATRGAVHGAFTAARAMPSKAIHGTRATARASHSHASHVEQPIPTAQPTPTKQAAHAKQLTPVTTMGTTTVATSVATRGEVHGAFTVTQAMSLQAQREPNALPSQAQASRSSASRTEQPTHVAQLAPEQPTLAAQHALVAQPASVVFQAAQVGPRQSQPSGPTIKPGAFSPYFFTDLAFPNSNLAPGIYHPSTAQGGIFLPSSSNPNGEQHLSRQVMELTSALAQQTTLVNQLLQRTKMQRVPNEESRRRTRADEEPLQQRPGKQPLDQPRTKRSGRVHSQLGPRDSVYSRFSARRSVHSRLSPRTSIHSRLRPHSDEQHGQPSRRSVHSWLGPQGAFPTSHRSRQHDGRREAVTQSGSSSTGSLRIISSPARNKSHAPQPRHRRAKYIEEQPRPAGHDWGQPRAPLPQQRQIQEEVERLFNERLRDFRRSEVADEALRQDMTNISRSPFTNEVEQAEPPRKFSMPHFTSYKGDGDPERHLKNYRSAMILYRNKDDLMCKIFSTTLQGEAQDWFYTLPPQSIRSFDELSLVFTKEYSSYRSIKKKSDHLFNVKKNPNESLRDYVKRFKAEKAKIVGCNDSIARAAFQKGLPVDHPLFGKLIMKEDLILADSFALAEKHALWDEVRRYPFEANPSDPECEVPHYSEEDSRPDWTSSRI